MSATATTPETLPAFGALTAFTRAQKWGKWTPVTDRAFRALMNNAEAGEDRLWSFALLTSWGNPSGPRKEAADENGRLLRLTDAARALGVSRQTVGRWLESLSAQNRLHYTDAGLTPVADPSVPAENLSQTPGTKPEPKGEKWQRFEEFFAAEFPELAEEEEELRKKRKRFKVLKLSLFKTWGKSSETPADIEPLLAEFLSRESVTNPSEPEPETLDSDVQTPSAFVPDSPPDSVPPSVTLSEPVLIDEKEEIEWEERVGWFVAEVPTYPDSDAIEEIEWEGKVGRSVAEVPTNLPENAIKTPPPEPENLPDTAEEIELLNILDRTGLAVPPDDPILAKFVALATAYSIPVISLCRAILDKCKQKAALGKRIFSAYALYDFLSKGDLRQWIAQHGREVEQDRRATREPEPEPEQTSDTGSIDEMRLGVEQALADPNISEQERNTYLGLLERMRTW